MQRKMTMIEVVTVLETDEYNVRTSAATPLQQVAHMRELARVANEDMR
jgi:hypothetical protein